MFIFDFSFNCLIRFFPKKPDEPVIIIFVDMINSSRILNNENFAILKCIIVYHFTYQRLTMY